MNPDAQTADALAEAGPSHSLARFAAELRPERIPPQAIERARIHILDRLGLGLASTAFPFAGPTLVAVQGLSGGETGCAVIGQRFRAAPRDAAMANGG